MEDPRDLITNDHVGKALHENRGKATKLISFKNVDFLKTGDHFSSSVTGMTVRYMSDGEEHGTTYVVKLNPCRTFKKFPGLNHTIFAKEGKFYQELLPELNATLSSVGRVPLHFPQCFHVSLEIDKEQIYFEDLRDRGYKMQDKRLGLDVHHSTLVLKELACIHAASQIFRFKCPEKFSEDGYGFLRRKFMTLVDGCEEPMADAFREYLSNAAEMLRKINGYERAVSWVEGLKANVKDIFSADGQNDAFVSICHGDCWNNNILFRYNAEAEPLAAMLLDLQGCHLGSLAYDINYFLFTSLRGDVRKDNLNYFLSIYYSTFQDIMESADVPVGFTKDDLLKEYRDKNTFGAFFGMVIVPNSLLDSEDFPEMSGNDIDYRELQKQMKEKALLQLDVNPLMKHRFLAIFDELMETGLIP